ncbi:hypothetical protein NKH73_13960 [Mesorhizobium sp. M0938]|uniref:hypothetical protein n=1 Tax=unclassified Mesorhizobium TaxID=325217 RepID=UPI00333A3D41
MKAIRIDKAEVLHGKRHINLLVDYQMRDGLSDGQIDAMIEAGRIEFGQVFLSADKRLEWDEDECRNSVYTSIDRMIEIGGRPS